MSVPRALILAVAASASTLAFAGCGSSDDSGDAASPAIDATTASTPASTPATPDGCPIKGTDAAGGFISGSKLRAAGDNGCTWAVASKPDAHKLTVQFGAAASLTKQGKYPDLYTVFKKAAKNAPKSNPEHYESIKNLGDDAYASSAAKPHPYASVSWVQNGNVFILKNEFFDKGTAARKASVKALETLAGEISKAQ